MNPNRIIISDHQEVETQVGLLNGSRPPSRSALRSQGSGSDARSSGRRVNIDDGETPAPSQEVGRCFTLFLLHVKCFLYPVYLSSFTASAILYIYEICIIKKKKMTPFLIACLKILLLCVFVHVLFVIICYTW